MYDNLFQYLRRERWEQEGTLFEPALFELNQGINYLGYVQMRAHIREVLGVCPQTSRIYGTEDYFFNPGLKKVRVDGVLAYLTLTQYREFQGTYATTYEDGRINFIVQTLTEGETPDNYRVQGETIYNWIRYGQECEDCGSPYLSIHATGTVCPACAESYAAKSYNHRVEDDLGFEITKDIRYGVELEYEGLTGREVILHLKGHALPKRDGSISNGVEIVTRPACIQTHKEKLSKFYDAVKVQAAPTTGMHVHVERKRLTQYQIGFLLQFLNHEDLIRQNQIVAGRQYSGNTYSRSNKEHKMTFGLSYDEGSQQLRRNNTDKYVPFNTNKPNTVEFRIFSSPESQEECAAKLDFVSALVQYSSPYSVSVKNLKDKFSYKVFLQYIQANRKEFIDFHNYYIKTNKLQEATT